MLVAFDKSTRNLFDCGNLVAPRRVGGNQPEIHILKF
jgi:hypothetical protein